MRLGGQIFAKFQTPGEWVAAVRAAGYSAVSSPIGLKNSGDEIAAYRRAAREADILIAEVGAWNNPISTDSAEREKSIDHCQRCLALAEAVGADACVNIAGSRGPVWDGPHPDNDSPETFDLIVETVRKIIDAVQPKNAVYTLETMPWVPPDSPDSYLALIKAIDRKAFAVHLDPVNMINCPGRAYHTGEFIRECFRKLSPWIRGVHAKDIRFTRHLTLHLDECPPGQGLLDYRVFLEEMGKLPLNTPMLMEHMTRAEDYETAGEYIRTIAYEVGVEIK